MEKDTGKHLLKAWMYIVPDPDWKPDTGTEKGQKLQEMRICEINPRDPGLPGKDVAQIVVGKGMTADEAMALADRVEKDPALIGTHPHVIDLRKPERTEIPVFELTEDESGWGKLAPIPKNRDNEMDGAK